MLNSLGRDIPAYIEGIGELEPFQGALTKLRKGWMDEPTIPAPNKAYLPHQSKLCSSLEEAIVRSNPRKRNDGFLSPSFAKRGYPACEDPHNPA